MTTAYRTAKLVIDIPVPGAEPFISGILQKVIVDENDQVIQIVPRQDEVYRRASAIAFEMTTFTDPVTGLEHTITGAGLDAAITTAVCRWIIEDLAQKGVTAIVNEHGRVVVTGE